MNNVNGIHPAWAPKPIEPASPVVTNVPAAAPTGVSDVVEISTAAALAAKVKEIPEVRTELVARVKKEIEAGTYETPERIDAAIDKLMEDLFPELL
jgi:negative regulator of flagellin synthesis FlgM